MEYCLVVCFQKNSFQTQGVGFSFLSQRARRPVFWSLVVPITSVSKLRRPFVIAEMPTQAGKKNKKNLH